MKTNDKNNFAKRTAGEVRGILSQFNLDLTVQNQGDGNLFMVYDNSIKTRFAIKQAGFILDRCNAGEKNCYFRCYE